MSDVLVIYATVEGQSRKIAEHVCDHTVRLGRNARVLDAANTPHDLALSTYDAVLVVAPIHMGRHHQAAVHFARDNAPRLQKGGAALISVSMHAAELEPGDLDECRLYVDELAAETGWIPEATYYAAGALKFATYDFFKRWMMRRIVADKGLEKEQANRDELEFTDWRALEMFVEGFLRKHPRTEN